MCHTLWQGGYLCFAAAFQRNRISGGKPLAVIAGENDHLELGKWIDRQVRAHLERAETDQAREVVRENERREQERRRSEQEAAAAREKEAEKRAVLAGFAGSTVLNMAYETVQRYDVFLSMRFDRTVKREGEALQTRLEALGIRTFLADPNPGASITTTVFDALQNSKIMVVLGTANYAEDTGNPASTYEELNFWQTTMQKERREYQGGLVPINMLKPREVHKHTLAKILFGSNKSYELWMPGEPLPEKVVRAIQKKLAPVAQMGVKDQRKTLFGVTLGGRRTQTPALPPRRHEGHLQQQPCSAGSAQAGSYLSPYHASHHASTRADRFDGFSHGHSNV